MAFIVTSNKITVKARSVMTSILEHKSAFYGVVHTWFPSLGAKQMVAASLQEILSENQTSV